MDTSIMQKSFLEHVKNELEAIRSQGLYKEERIIVSSQDAKIRLKDGREVLNFCANNYLGLANHPDLIESAHKPLWTNMALDLPPSASFAAHKRPFSNSKRKISAFLRMEDTLLYSSCFDANGGLFETFLTSKMPSYPTA